MLDQPGAFEGSAVASHHWLVRRRGGERVFEAILDLLPRAPVYTLIHDRRGYKLPVRPDGQPRSIQQSALRFVPGAKSHYSRLLPLLPWAARSMKLPPVELAVCSDAAIAKAMQVDRRTKLVCYCHSPMRYAWDLSDEYLSSVPRGLRALWPRLVKYLRRVDREAAQRVDVFVANSKYVADRIRRSYDRESQVVYPPVGLPDAPPKAKRGDFYLCVGRHVAYKRLDLAVEACRKLGRKLLVVGEVPGHPASSKSQSIDLARMDDFLAGLAPGQPAFVGWQSDAVIRACYVRARGLLFCGIEDFGIVPVEAMAHGCPVIAYSAGGACETVRPARTGILFDHPSIDSVCQAMLEREKQEFDPAQMLALCQAFKPARFHAEMLGVLKGGSRAPTPIAERLRD